MSEQLGSDGWRLHPVVIPPLFAVLCCVLVMAVLWRRRPGARRGATFAPVAAVAAVWQLATALLFARTVPEGALFLSRVVIGAIVLLPATSFAFADALVPMPHARLVKRVGWAFGLIPLAFVFLDPAVVVTTRVPAWGGQYPLVGPHFLPVLLVSQIGAYVTSGWLAVGALRMPPCRRRRQIAYVLLAYLSAGTTWLDLRGVTGQDVFPVSWMSALGCLAAVGYAIARWRLLDVRTALHRTLLAVLAVAAALVPLYLLATEAAGWVGWQQPIARVLATLVIVGAAQLLVGRADATLRAVVAGRRRRHALILERFSRDALDARRPEELLDVLADALREAGGLELKAVALAIDVGDGVPAKFAVLPEGSPAAPHSPARRLPDEPCTRAELDPGALAEAVGDQAELLVLDRAVARWLDVYGAHVLIPLRHEELEFGVVLARAPRPELTLSPATRELLGRLAARAAVAFTNAFLYAELARKSASLEQAVTARTAELARAVHELKLAQASLVQAEKQSSLGVLVAGVSHEINNALNFIYENVPALERYAQAYDELFERAAAAGVPLAPLLAARVDEARRLLAPAITQASEAAQRARSIVEDLRRFARRDEVERRKADVRDGLESTINLLRAELGQRVSVERRFDAEVMHVDCLPTALNHVFLNVLLNAAQAIDGPGTITTAVREGEGGAVIEVADSGRGVAPTDRERIFEPFYTTRRRAAGLGLAVSRQIVQRHGGTIELVDNPSGRGSLVRIFVPFGGDALAEGEGA